MANHLHHIAYKLLGLTVLVSSCSQENLERGDNPQPGAKIEFNASLPEVDTRATEMTASMLNDFQVSAFKEGTYFVTTHFDNKKFTRNSTTGLFFSIDPECIWPNNNDLLRFYAFYPSREIMMESGGEATIAGDRITGFKVPHDIASQFDFITAITSGRLVDCGDNGVGLQFKHQLSRIMINAWGSSKNFDLEIAGVRIGGVGTSGEFSFSAGQNGSESNQNGEWRSIGKGNVEYVFRSGDEIVVLDGTDATPNSVGKAVSIMGAKVGGNLGYDNSAMIIPSDNSKWDYENTPANGDKHETGMYISVLLRVTDDTPYDRGNIVYPYSDGAETDDIVYLAIDKADGKTVKAQVYKRGEDYFTDSDKKDSDTKYDLSQNNAEVKAFGWAALPVKEAFLPGRIYTYTLNYTNGVGLRDPHDPNPGTSIISDRVLVNVEVAEWQQGSDNGIQVPRK